MALFYKQFLLLFAQVALEARLDHLRFMPPTTTTLHSMYIFMTHARLSRCFFYNFLALVMCCIPGGRRKRFMVRISYVSLACRISLCQQPSHFLSRQLVCGRLNKCITVSLPLLQSALDHLLCQVLGLSGPDTAASER